MSGKIMELFGVEGKVAVVTGAAGGLGAATAKGLAEAGVKVVAGDIQDAKERLPETVVFRKMDVSRKSDVDGLVDEACRRFGRIDLMVANAAFGGGAAAEKETEEGWDRVFDVNAKGVFLCDQAAARKMIPQGGGCIVNIASILSYFGHPMCVSYCSSKGAVVQLTRTLSIEWAKYNIRVNAIAPGFFRTPMNAATLANEKFMKPVVEKAPMNRPAEPHEIVGTVIYLASNASSFVTGSIVSVDGGELAAGGFTDATVPFMYDLV